MFKFTLLTFFLVAVVIICAFYFEVVRAKEVDPKKPFLWDDYDEKKDKTWK
jgi:hypothetical protein